MTQKLAEKSPQKGFFRIFSDLKSLRNRFHKFLLIFIIRTLHNPNFIKYDIIFIINVNKQLSEMSSDTFLSIDIP